MALTPMDIAQKEFSHAMRGYSVEEVDAFLDEVKDEFATLLTALEESRRTLASYEQKVAHYVEIESTLNSAFVSAQQSADAIKNKANQEANVLLDKARAEGERIRSMAEQQRRDMERQIENEKRAHQLEIARLKESEDRFRKEYAALIAHFTAELQDIPVNDSESASGAIVEEFMLEASSASVAEPVFAPAEPEQPIVVAEEAPIEVAVAAEPEITPEPEPALAPVAEPEPTPEPAAAPIEEPAAPVEAPAPAEPAAPAAPATAAYGEMEDDLDIEEID